MGCNWKNPEKLEKHEKKFKILLVGPPFFCKTALFLGQKQPWKRRMVCKLLLLCGLATAKTVENRRIREIRGRGEIVEEWKRREKK
jgi:hypothetical protein